MRARSNNIVWQLSDGPVSAEHWDLVFGDFNEWQVIGGRLQGHLLPPPAVSSNRSAIAPRRGLWSVTGNYQFAFDFIALDGADKNFGILFDYYPNERGKILLSVINFHFINQELSIKAFKNNYLTHMALMPCPLIPGKTYRLKVVYQKPDFELFIDGQLFFSTKNDGGFWPDFLEPGRPLFYLTRGGYEQSAVIYNNFKLTFFPQLAIPYFSQLDFRWVDKTYDHSQEFFDPPLTIGTSGCALTSAAMLINYYGYDTFPDQENWLSELRGESINPDTLNIWLNNEADGYVGLALVNWLAITRLTALLAESATQAKPALEFTYADYQIEVVDEQLIADQPVIADLDGHFVVLTGIQDDKQDGLGDSFLINDPAGTNSLLDQQRTPIQSLRLFKLSQTDLSYWLLISPEELDIQVSNSERHQLEATLAIEKNLLNLAQPWFLYYWPQPALGSYLWHFNLSDLEKMNLAQLLIYQSDGRVQIFNLADYAARNLQLNFAKDQLSELSINQDQKFFLHYHRYLLNHLLQGQKAQLLLGKIGRAHLLQKLIERFLNFYQL